MGANRKQMEPCPRLSPQYKTENKSKVEITEVNRYTGPFLD